MGLSTKNRNTIARIDGVMVSPKLVQLQGVPVKTPSRETRAAWRDQRSRQRNHYHCRIELRAQGWREAGTA